ncbi:MAG: hypothetical protein A2X18_10855 [Bacteroidetes bacterium GWF2_40_14]|nr:MAG: hypothetical protein A2X18_10855 [Bacteroidetes bacterium GWF2_40_14]
MSTILIIIAGVVIYSIIRFAIDYYNTAQKNTLKGGLITKHQAFAEYCASPLRMNRMELVINSGDRLEYRLPIKNNDAIVGYIHFGIYDVFTVVAYCKAVSKNGYTHKGFSKEINNWRNFDSTDYDPIFESLFAAIVNSKDFQLLGFE